MQTDVIFHDGSMSYISMQRFDYVKALPSQNKKYVFQVSEKMQAVGWFFAILSLALSASTYFSVTY